MISGVITPTSVHALFLTISVDKYMNIKYGSEKKMFYIRSLSAIEKHIP